eukprot:12544002-Alexandrium_andersonii.AAC.1
MPIRRQPTRPAADEARTDQPCSRRLVHDALMQIPAAGQPRAESRSAAGQEAAWPRSGRRRRGTAPRQAQPEPCPQCSASQTPAAGGTAACVEVVPGAAGRGLRREARSDQPGNWKQRCWATAQLACPGDGRARRARDRAPRSRTAQRAGRRLIAHMAQKAAARERPAAA